ncbi:MAG: DUF1015 domain-containing protein [Oscillospiraceae bacterium]
MDKLFIPGEILLPKAPDLSLWSVIACDQYTSQPEYWDGVDKKVGDTPSTLRMILPEAYLESRDNGAETEKINRNMEKYLAEGVFKAVPDSYIYIERGTLNGDTRRGLLGLIDLEAYDYRAASTSPIHATEGTVESRLPPRVKVREGAALELPHIIVFVDDPQNTVFDGIDGGEVLYDFELMENGGHLRGSRVSGEKAEKVEKALSALAEPEYLERRYALKGRPPIVIAMGDGNHSLATARLCWENLKKTLTPEEQKQHPARFALAELVNIHDSSIVFEPIHRVVFETDTAEFFNEARSFFKAAAGKGETPHKITCVCGDKREEISVEGLTIGRTISVAQEFCLGYMNSHGGKIDYIHDDATALEMSEKPGCIGLLLPPMDKNELYSSIIESGVFPAKSFSIGPSHDKRYYLECRKIK